MYQEEVAAVDVHVTNLIVTDLNYIWRFCNHTNSKFSVYEPLLYGFPVM
jgi:hypothetical protein